MTLFLDICTAALYVSKGAFHLSELAGRSGGFECEKIWAFSAKLSHKSTIPIYDIYVLTDLAGQI